MIIPLLAGIVVVGIIIYLIWFFNATHLCPNCGQAMQIQKRSSFGWKKSTSRFRMRSRYGLHIEWIRVCPHCGYEKK